MYVRFSKWMTLALAVGVVASAPLAVSAQVAAKPVAKGYSDQSLSRWDAFIGYSFHMPTGTNYVTPVGGTPTGYTFEPQRVGSDENFTYYLTRHIGWQLDSGQHDRYVFTGPLNQHYSNSGFATIQTGPVYRFEPHGNWVPFLHAVAGTGEMHGPDGQFYTWGPTFAAGGGLDYRTSWLHHHLAIRVIQADVQYVHVNYGTQTFYNETADWGSVNSFGPRLSAGFVLHGGHIPPPTQIQLACTPNPVTVYPGDPETVTARSEYVEPNANVLYTFAGTGVTANGESASVATAGLAPGSYTVACGVKEGKKGKEGKRAWENASASAVFNVKAYEPPTISCLASPSTIKPGDTSTVTATALSPQNRPLTITYAATSGTLAGSGNTAVFSSTGAPTGPVGITCNVADDKGQSATANTSVMIVAPYVAPVPHTQALCSIAFDKDTKRPARVDNEAKACLDEVALDLQKQADAKVVVVGESTAAEKAPKKHAKKNAKVEDLAGERAVNTKEYLVTEKGIDASRVSTAVGTAGGQKAENYLVPAGASFSSDVAGTSPVDESTVKPQARKPLPVKTHTKKVK